MKYRTPSYGESTFDYYFFEKNLQGDIIAVYSGAGTKLCTFKYDAWGYSTISYESGVASSTKWFLNDHCVFRYRGYYYDSETGYYYLQSRYYNPQWGRFINADGYINGNGDIIGYNMFAYCSNNPVMYTDPTGESVLAIIGGLALGTFLGALFGGLTAEATGGDFWAGAAGGAVSGLISTAGTALAITTGGFGGLAIAGALGFGAGLGGSVVQQGIEKGFSNVDTTSALISGSVSLVSNIMCYGATNFAMRESVGLFEDVFDKSIPFLTRYGSALSISPEAVLCTGMFSVPSSIAYGIMEYILYRSKIQSQKSVIQLAY